MFESIRKWLVKALIQPEDVGDFLANEGYFDETVLKIPKGEVKKTDAAKKVLLAKAISIVEIELNVLQQGKQNDKVKEPIALKNDS